MRSVTLDRLPENVPNADAAAGALQQIVQAFSQMVTISEQESTKRAAISAQLEARMEEIASSERMLAMYFNKIFAERDKVFTRFFDELDRARESGDTTHVAQALTGLVDLARETPLKDLLNLSTIHAQLTSGRIDLGGSS
jgi:hypothetical protein